jgi:hypothetical protein
MPLPSPFSYSFPIFTFSPTHVSIFGDAFFAVVVDRDLDLRTSVAIRRHSAHNSRMIGLRECVAFGPYQLRFGVVISHCRRDWDVDQVRPREG